MDMPEPWVILILLSYFGPNAWVILPKCLSYFPKMLELFWPKSLSYFCQILELFFTISHVDIESFVHRTINHLREWINHLMLVAIYCPTLRIMGNDSMEISNQSRATASNCGGFAPKCRFWRAQKCQKIVAIRHPKNSMRFAFLQNL